MTLRAALAAIIIFIVSSGAVWAHDGHVHKIMGVVMARDARHLEVKTPSGEVLSIAITDKTSVLRAKRKVAIGEVEVGRRVVVAIGNGEDPLIAGEIQVGVVDAAARQTN
jgi:hypothetical protein